MNPRLFLSFLILLAFSSCNNTPIIPVVQYPDSLIIKDGNKQIQVAILNLKTESAIRPYTNIYKGHLLVLTGKDHFCAYSALALSRDTAFENRLNGKLIRKAFVISDTLYGISDLGLASYYDDEKNNWYRVEKLTRPFYTSPIYVDEKYICYTSCKGEFGGYVFFVNRKTGKATVAISQCNSGVLRSLNGYLIFSNIDMYNFSSIVEIQNPDLLYELPDTLKNFTCWNLKRSYENRFIEWDIDSMFRKACRAIYSTFNGPLITAGILINGQKYCLANYFENTSTKTYFTKLVGDTLQKIPCNNSVIGDLSKYQYTSSKVSHGIMIIDFQTRRTEKPLSLDPHEQGSIPVTFLIYDNKLIRVNWDY